MKIKKILMLLCMLHITALSQQLPQTGNPIHTVNPLNIKQQEFKKGSLTVFCGSMCSGKSEELIRQVGRFILAGFEVLVFKPSIDNRKILDLELDPLHYIPSRTGSWVNCIPVTSVQDIYETALTSSAHIIAIDEVMFFNSEKDALLSLIRSLVKSNKKVLVAGLDLDFRAEPFGIIPELLAYADKVIKLTAICNVCGDDTFCLTQRLVNGQPAHYNDPLIMVGSTEYEPRCRTCHIIKKD